MILRVSVYSPVKQDIRIIVYDPNYANTVLTDRYMSVRGNFSFYVRMPICKKYVDVQLMNNDTGLDSSFTYQGCKKLALERRMAHVDLNSNRLKEFLVFIQKFSYNAGWLDTNDPNNPNAFYVSGNKNFRIKYLPVIRDYVSGKELATPMRISDDGTIEASQKYIIPATVPGRIAEGLHEYSHLWTNEDPDDESEADLNGLYIYLCLGYPRIEGGQVWCSVFEEYPSDENMQRIAIVQRFIDDFEKNDMVIKPFQ